MIVHVHSRTYCLQTHTVTNEHIYGAQYIHTHTERERERERERGGGGREREGRGEKGGRE